MTTHHDKQKALQAFWDAEKAFFDKVVAIIRASIGIFTNAIDIANRYIAITGALAAGLHIVSMLPAAVLGPITSMLSVIMTLNNSTASLASKVINVTTTAGSSTTSITGLFLQSVALPLAITGATLGLIKESWGLGELLYRRYYKNDTKISSMDWFDAIQGVVLAAITLTAAGMMFFPPAIPVAYAIFCAVTAYKFLESIGKNPIKSLLGLYDKEKTESTVSAEEPSTAIIENALVAQDTPTAPSHHKTISPEATSTQPNKPSPSIKIKSRYNLNVYGVLPDKKSVETKERKDDMIAALFDEHTKRMTSPTTGM